MVKGRGPRSRTIWDRMGLRLKGIAKCGRSTHILISATATRRIRICIATTCEVTSVLSRCSPRRRWVIIGVVRTTWSICGGWRLRLELWRSRSWGWWELLALRVEACLSGIRVVGLLGALAILLLLLRIVRILIRILSISSLLLLP